MPYRVQQLVLIHNLTLGKSTLRLFSDWRHFRTGQGIVYLVWKMRVATTRREFVLQPIAMGCQSKTLLIWSPTWLWVELAPLVPWLPAFDESATQRGLPRKGRLGKPYSARDPQRSHTAHSQQVLITEREGDDTDHVSRVLTAYNTAHRSPLAAHPSH
jgi:hypothetical protein